MSVGLWVVCSIYEDWGLGGVWRREGGGWDRRLFFEIAGLFGKGCVHASGFCGALLFGWVESDWIGLDLVGDVGVRAEIRDAGFGGVRVDGWMLGG